MSRVLDGAEPEEEACQGKKLYVEPQLTREEVLSDIVGDPTIPIAFSPGVDL